MTGKIDKAKNALRRFSFAAAWMGGAGRRAERYEKSDIGIWAETVNPLRGLTADRAAVIFDRARTGIYAELAWLYQEIEAADPLLFVCTERREAAAGACDWRISLANPGRTRGYEENLAAEQQQFLSAAYGRAGDEIGALAEHLDRGFFRGFAHARPVWEAGGVSGFEFYDQWNFARDPATGEWWWNPDAACAASDHFEPIPEGELVTLERSRHIDYPALAVFIRSALGEKKWGIFLERYGIPPVTIIMPEFAEKNEEKEYMEAAEKLARAGSGALPFGSTVSYATEARGTNPFSEFLRHQQELTVLLATGGLLTTLTAPGSGTLAGNAHLETWRAVVARDIRAVSRAVNRAVTRRLLETAFPGRPALAYFEFDPEPAPAAGEIFELAAKAKSAGYRVAKGDLEERTGFALEIDDSASFGAAFNTAAPRTVAKPLQNAHNAPEAKSPVTGAAGDATQNKGILGAIPDGGADPAAAALAALESGASVDEALDAYDRAAAGLMAPEAVAARAERIAAELEDAAKEGKGET